ncbi:MAG TPA: uroporphyrinogen-III synthase [Steroidobacteraceae bacterium]|nr:uroporphyrinogen-III synthase [Steroidobacteraceae bacterium]
MQPKVIAVLETRTGAQLADLIERRLGAKPLHAPALEEVPEIDPQALRAALAAWQSRPFDVAIFQTGVGTRALFKATDELGQTPTLAGLLARATVVVRGPKPTGELNARGVRIDRRALSPFTTDEVLDALAPVDLAGKRVIVQRYGDANEPLRAALAERGASVEEITTYRWGLPKDSRPLEALIEALSERRVDAVVFTSAVQVHNLELIAARCGRAAELPALLGATCIASIGPVCSRALEAIGVRPTLQAEPPKLGFLMSALERYFAER